jgi:hypothetical protein
MLLLGPDAPMLGHLVRCCAVRVRRKRADADRRGPWGARRRRSTLECSRCGHIGDALLERLRPSDGDPAQFSVGFMSVLAGTLLAAQAIKDAVRRAGSG